MKIRNILKIFSGMLLIIIFIESFYSKFIKKEFPVNLFGLSFLCVSTGSMEPSINIGECIIINRKEKYFKNDIVTYLDNDGFLITHRIIDIDEDNVICKGDNNNLNDPEVSVDNIKGKVIIHSKTLGFFIIYILKPLICIYVLILIFFSIYEFINNLKEETNDKKTEQ